MTRGGGAGPTGRSESWDLPMPASLQTHRDASHTYSIPGDFQPRALRNIIKHSKIWNASKHACSHFRTWSVLLFEHAQTRRKHARAAHNGVYEPGMRSLG